MRYAIAKLGSKLNVRAGLKLEGADWTDAGLSLNNGESRLLGSTYIVWRKAGTAQSGEKGKVNLPVYLNPDRSSVLFGVDLDAEGCEQAEVAQRGVCLTAL